ncbi:hypothetical protein E3O06_05835 [Cryobacterium glaciale]|uniref:DUF6916 domain-containing protein n=1 Tax=Cryobacterium glaciale TaxID=1259145 RepID=A0A4R8UZR1_9MICO|nr:hypothetical protein [Cryobacterium glaciale]TFB75343.1 hypothetical protein E3O06_05835 [Cryobacterium glaciale]
MLDISRRSVMTLGIGTVGLATLTVIAQPSLALAATRLNLLAPADPVRSNFTGLIGQVFRADATGGSFGLTLTAVHDLEPATVLDDELRFNLIFDAADALPAEGIYLLSNADAAPTSLFISSIGSTEGPTTMQALVNRRV